MTQISAAGNLSIELQPNRWRLLINGNAEETVLLEANAGQPVRYLPRFGSKRRLPDSGSMPVAYIQRVVLGWSREDESWHLGLVLEPSLAQARGSRWCEIAHWPDPETTVFADVASQAGQSLARTITRPFNLIPPRAEPQAPPPPPLPELPLKFDLWTLERAGSNRIQFTRASTWARSRVVRVLWYSFWVIVYVVLAATTLLRGIALPSPEFLPYLGLSAALVLVGMIAYLLYQLLTTPSRIVVDAGSGNVVALRGSRPRWRINREQVLSVYVSQIVGRRGKQRKIQHGELNLFLNGGRFLFLVEQGHPEMAAEEPHLSLNGHEPTDAVTALTQAKARTDLQAAGIYVAQALNVPCMYDRRSN
jgi:hypothetical protein